MTTYWASFGKSGYLGRFAGAGDFARGTKVVVQSPRGVEVATILDILNDKFDGTISGTILRDATDNDVIDPTAFKVDDGPALVVDAEVLLDGPVILHVLPLGELDRWLAALGERFQRPVRVIDLSVAPKEPGCNEAGCGGGNCGNGCGTCSKGSVKSSAEMTAYFAGLREAMHRKELV